MEVTEYVVSDRQESLGPGACVVFAGSAALTGVSFPTFQLTACLHGSVALLYPMYWQHVYIPVLPAHLLDYCW